MFFLVGRAQSKNIFKSNLCYHTAHRHMSDDDDDGDVFCDNNLYIITDSWHKTVLGFCCRTAWTCTYQNWTPSIIVVKI